MKLSITFYRSVYVFCLLLVGFSSAYYLHKAFQNTLQWYSLVQFVLNNTLLLILTLDFFKSRRLKRKFKEPFPVKKRLDNTMRMFRS